MTVPRPQCLSHVALDLFPHDPEALKIGQLLGLAVRRQPLHILDDVGYRTFIGALLETVSTEHPRVMLEQRVGMVPNRWLKLLQEIASNLMDHHSQRGAQFP